MIGMWLYMYYILGIVNASYDIFHQKKLPGPLFTKRTEVLPQNLIKSQSREIWV